MACWTRLGLHDNWKAFIQISCVFSELIIAIYWPVTIPCFKMIIWTSSKPVRQSGFLHSFNRSKGHFIVTVPWKLPAFPPFEEGQGETARCFKDYGSLDSHKRGSRPTFSRMTCWWRLRRRTSPAILHLYHTRGDWFEGFLWVAYSASLGRDSEHLQVDEREESGDVSNVSKWDGTICSMEGDPGILHCFLSTC